MTRHFIAMLAFHLSNPVTYRTPLVIGSIFPAIISSGLALSIISRPVNGDEIKVLL
ncbi:MHYT domain-containing protein [Peribacillus deserti]|uniref:MHYT domain-containing protein n=1 Tax=Peribacillus deserti TaxID=673318 RepID=A0A2N5M257_9BACI|nr:MHYT domain-containing protein [Peribacillus deserti]PLT28431.1 hypothetical protein CUU66_18485 [Peribacillus deserti]